MVDKANVVEIELAAGKPTQVKFDPKMTGGAQVFRLKGTGTIDFSDLNAHGITPVIQAFPDSNASVVGNVVAHQGHINLVIDPQKLAAVSVIQDVIPPPYKEPPKAQAVDTSLKIGTLTKKDPAAVKYEQDEAKRHAADEKRHQDELRANYEKTRIPKYTVGAAASVTQFDSPAFGKVTRTNFASPEGTLTFIDTAPGATVDFVDTHKGNAQLLTITGNAPLAENQDRMHTFKVKEANHVAADITKKIEGIKALERGSSPPKFLDIVKVPQENVRVVADLAETPATQGKVAFKEIPGKAITPVKEQAEIAAVPTPKEVAPKGTPAPATTAKATPAPETSTKSAAPATPAPATPAPAAGASDEENKKLAGQVSDVTDKIRKHAKFIRETTGKKDESNRNIKGYLNDMDKVGGQVFKADGTVNKAALDGLNADIDGAIKFIGNDALSGGVGKEPRDSMTKLLNDLKESVKKSVEGKKIAALVDPSHFSNVASSSHAHLDGGTDVSPSSHRHHGHSPATSGRFT